MELKDVVLEALAELENAQIERERVSSYETKKESFSHVNSAEQNAPLQPLNQVLSDEEKTVHTHQPIAKEPTKEVTPTQQTTEALTPAVKIQTVVNPAELRFLQSLRERILVLFEGFQSPNNVKIEAKVDLMLNFLEYTLAAIDERSTQIKEQE